MSQKKKERKRKESTKTLLATIETVLDLQIIVIWLTDIYLLSSLFTSRSLYNTCLKNSDTPFPLAEIHHAPLFSLESPSKRLKRISTLRYNNKQARSQPKHL